MPPYHGLSSGGDQRRVTYELFRQPPEVAADAGSNKAIIKRLVPDAFQDPGVTASSFVSKYWEIYNRDFLSNPNTNGKVFEALISMALCREGVLPHYIQAKITHIPGVNYDCIIYTEEFGPISISAKTSLRERWKQADLEALALKNIFRKSQSYLVSMSEMEISRRKRDPDSVLALNGFILASAPEFDALLARIRGYTLMEAPNLPAISSNETVLTAETCQTYYA